MDPLNIPLFYITLQLILSPGKGHFQKRLKNPDKTAIYNAGVISTNRTEEQPPLKKDFQETDTIQASNKTGKEQNKWIQSYGFCYSYLPEQRHSLFICTGDLKAEALPVRHRLRSQIPQKKRHEHTYRFTGILLRGLFVDAPAATEKTRMAQRFAVFAELTWIYNRRKQYVLQMVWKSDPTNR